MYLLLIANLLSMPTWAAAPVEPSSAVVVSSDLLSQYDAIRVALSQDKREVAASAARALAGNAPDDAPLAADAMAIGNATDLQGQRTAFAELSRLLITRLAGASAGPKVVVYHCPMWQGYGWWLQLKSGLANPYMGTAMPECGEEMSLKAAVKATAMP